MKINSKAKKKILSALSFTLCTALVLCFLSFSFVFSAVRGLTILGASLSVPSGIPLLLNNILGKNVISVETNTLTYDNVYVSEYLGQIQKNAEEIGVPTDQSAIPEEHRGPVYEKFSVSNAGGKIISYGAGLINNSTSHSNETVSEIISTPPSFKMQLDGSVEVLILHTHGTESFNSEDSGFYDKRLGTRDTNEENNMIAVGKVLYEELKKLGVGVVHDTTYHDHPAFSGCYDRQKVTVEKYLKQYPTIKVIIDLHRDAIENDEGLRTKPTAIINGKKAAQIMILSGCENGYMNFPNWAENLRFNARLQSNIEATHPGLTKPVYFNYSKYNQNLLTGATLIEMGSNANTLEEAKYTAELIAAPIYETLKQLK